MARKAAGKGKIEDLSIAVNAPNSGKVTARIEGGLTDLELGVDPAEVGLASALRHMAKAINLALKADFLETKLEPAYEAARVRKGTVELLHRDYIGLGDGVLAQVGRAARSFSLTLEGPDPASPRGRETNHYRGGMIRGLFDLLGRKMDLIQEYEDMVPVFVQQMLDRLEANRVIVGWRRDQWTIETKKLGLDVVMTPIAVEEEGDVRARPKARRKTRRSS